MWKDVWDDSRELGRNEDLLARDTRGFDSFADGFLGACQVNVPVSAMIYFIYKKGFGGTRHRYKRYRCGEIRSGKKWIMEREKEECVSTFNALRIQSLTLSRAPGGAYEPLPIVGDCLASGLECTLGVVPPRLERRCSDAGY